MAKKKISEAKIKSAKIRALLKERDKENKIKEQAKNIVSHPPLKMVIHKTTNYGIFKPHRYQRKCEQRKTNKIIKSILEIGYWPQLISVTSDMKVPIGQHRIEAAKHFGLPVYYTICEDVSQQVIVGLEASTKWNAEDKLQSCANSGIPSAIVINDLRIDWLAKGKRLFINGKKISAPHILAIVLKSSDLLSGINKINLTEILEKTPIPTNEDLEFANKFIDVFMYIQSNCVPKGIRIIDLQRAFIDVVVHNEDKFNFAGFKKKLKNHKFIYAPNVGSYVIQVVDLYNKKIRKQENRLDYYIKAKPVSSKKTKKNN